MLVLRGLSLPRGHLANERWQGVVSTLLRVQRCGKAQAGLILASFREWHELGLEG